MTVPAVHCYRRPMPLAHYLILIYSIRMDYSRFQSVYANIPAKLRTEIIAVIDGEPYTWYAAYLEITNNSELGKKIYAKLIKLEII